MNPVDAMHKLLAALPAPEAIKTIERDDMGRVVRLIEATPAINLSPTQAQAFISAVDALLPELVGTTRAASEMALIAGVVALRNFFALRLLPRDTAPVPVPEGRNGPIRS